VDSTAAQCVGDTLLISVPTFHLDTAVKVKNLARAGLGFGGNPGEGHAPRLWVWPNPARSYARLLLEGTPVAGCEYSVYDVMGNLVWSARGLAQEAVTWENRDQTGAPLPSGIYFGKARGGSMEARRKIVLLR